MLTGLPVTVKKERVTAKQFYDWQTSGGTDDVMRLVDCLERHNVRWCAIGEVAVSHWAAEPMVTPDVDFVVVAEDLGRVVDLLSEAGFGAERHQWSVNFVGRSKVSIQLSTEEIYLGFPERSVAADVHGILLRVASLEDTLRGKILAWRDPTRRQSKRFKDYSDIARMVESHPQLWAGLPEELRTGVEQPRQ